MMTPQDKRVEILRLIRELGKDCKYEDFEDELIRRAGTGTMFAAFVRYHTEVFGVAPLQLKPVRSAHTTLSQKLNSVGMLNGDVKEQPKESPMERAETTVEKTPWSEVKLTPPPSHPAVLPSKTELHGLGSLPEPEEVVSAVKADMDLDSSIDPRDAYESFAKVLFITQRIGIARMRRYVDLVSEFLEVK